MMDKLFKKKRKNDKISINFINKNMEGDELNGKTKKSYFRRYLEKRMIKTKKLAKS